MIAAILLLLFAVLFRVLIVFAGHDPASWVNFSPLAAIALCGAVFLPRRLALALPLGALLLSDLILNLHYQAPLLELSILVRYLALFLVAGIGFALRSNPTLGRMVGGSLAGSVLFYLVTNTASWMTSAAYVKSLGGWIQALTVGQAGVVPPTWVFFRNSLCSDLLFTLVFVGCMALAAKRKPAPAALDQSVARTASD
jgi:hypothetical protein